MKAVLKAEYPKGIDIIYESVGGEMFDTCVNALAPRGQLLVIGEWVQQGIWSSWLQEKGRILKQAVVAVE